MRSNNRKGYGRSSSASSCESGKQGQLFTKPCSRLFVGGLSDDVTEDDIFSMMSKVATVKDIYLKKKQNSSSFAFVQFNSIEEAQDVISATNGRKLRDKMICVKFAKPKNDAPSQPFSKPNPERQDREKQKKPWQQDNQEYQPRGNQERGGGYQRQEGFAAKKRDEDEGRYASKPNNKPIQKPTLPPKDLIEFDY